MISIPRQQLAAALKCAPKDEIRQYPNGVLFEVTTCGDTYLVSTDGNVMFVGALFTACEQKGPFSLVIPHSALTTAVKEKGYTLRLECAGGDIYRIGESLFSPLPGVFPNWRRLAVAPTVGGETAQFDPKRLMKAAEALTCWSGGSGGTHLYHDGEWAAVMTGWGDSAFCVIAPAKKADTAFPFIPSPY